ncbi:WD40 repeat-like protein [Dacryopinax primogenitus]|uniref:DNA damage-binding protein CMR1 n=1 Tax=Dacryopinax primogenitus (strain DJM 731) TaxID=1858805 RepID=M5GGJ3_DACPD|nr:WD40 repeat-like protein [Dacryopinax primogenitus]EJU05588.1 WD40 repeat-like protein [Dacryopinax primogenitus]
MSTSERERLANIAHNKAILAQLKLDTAGEGFFGPKPAPPIKEKKAKPVQTLRKRRSSPVLPERVMPTRSSTRLKRAAFEDPNESPDAKKRRLESEAEARRLQEEEAMAEIERQIAASRPRHQDLDLSTMGIKEEEESLASLSSTFRAVDVDGAKRSYLGDVGVDEDVKGDPGMEDLKERFAKLVVKSRAKVTEDRIYSAVYHPERTKDLIFFGDKHGQLGIWDAQAPPDEPADEEDEEAKETAEGGKYWRLQPHWPATSKSSISCVKIDPLNAQCMYTTAYDCTLRHTSFESSVSREIFSLEKTLLSTVDITPSGQELWISDVQGGLTHLDIREPRYSAVRWSINEAQKIGCVSVNPTSPHLLLTASNDRTIKIWDSRKLPHLLQPDKKPKLPPTPPHYDDLAPLYSAEQGKKGYGLLKAQFEHRASASSAYWDPSGRKIVSTSYDDHLRVWDLKGESLAREAPFQVFKPRRQISHNCQTGRWLTILRAQWSPNPDVHPHFTVGNMEHSLDVFSHTGEVVAQLYDSTKITAVQAVTCSHPSIVERAVSGNASGRCILWAPGEE